MNRPIGAFCPIHETLVPLCGYSCYVERAAYVQAAQALRQYFYNRRQGRQPCRNPAHRFGCGHGCKRVAVERAA